MSVATVEALNKFEVVDKPKVIANYKGKYSDLMVALKNLSNDKAIRLPMDYIGGSKFESFRVNITAQAKKLYQMRIYVMQEHGSIVVFKR